MGFYKKINFSPNTDIYIWKITENIDYLFSNVILKPNSLERVSNMKSISHRKGFLAVRMLLQHCGYSDHDLIYCETGKPILIDGKCISITHSFDFSVIAISDYPIGIDIELRRNKILKIANKFSEEKFIENCKDENLKIRLYTISWGAKEAIFKVVNQTGISFLDHIFVHEFKIDKGKTFANLKWQNDDKIFEIYFKEIENYTLVYAYEQ